MLINQVSKITGLTKKAIEYYTLQELISPSVLDNGYRDYSQHDVESLGKISVLRRLDISTQEIKELLLDDSNAALQAISVRKELNLQRESVKIALLNKLSSGTSYLEISEALQQMVHSKTITEKLLDAFPGYYGRYLCLHFARFLNEPIQTAQQQAAYERIISFLDDAPSLDFPEELQEYLMEDTKHINIEQMNQILENTKHSIEHPEDFLSTNKAQLEWYLAYKQSDEYKNSPAYKMMTLMKKFCDTSGYYDIFIPALKELSPSYLEYHQQMELANEALLNQYPEIEALDK